MNRRYRRGDLGRVIGFKKFIEFARKTKNDRVMFFSIIAQRCAHARLIIPRVYYARIMRSRDGVSNLTDADM